MPDRRAICTKPRSLRLSTWARTWRAGDGQANAPMISAIVHYAHPAHQRGDQDQEEQRRHREKDVDQHAQHRVDPAAEIAAGKADQRAQHRADGGRDQADQHRVGNRFGQLDGDALAQGGGAQQRALDPAAGAAGSCPTCAGQGRSRAALPTSAVSSMARKMEAPITKLRLRRSPTGCPCGSRLPVPLHRDDGHELICLPGLRSESAGRSTDRPRRSRSSPAPPTG